MLNLKSRESGFTLIEFMIGITVGLIVLWGLSTVYVNTSLSSRTSNTANQLNQDMRAVMDIMVNDIRRAGFGSTTSSGSSLFTTTDTDIQTDGACILYSYDATYAGGTASAVDSIDFMGFRISGGAIQTLVPGALTSTSTATPCAAATTATTVWDNLTDPNAVTVTALAFDTIGSKCIAFLPATYTPSDSTTFTTWTTASGAGRACVSTASNAPGTYPDTTHTFVETRQVNITLTARSSTDTTLTRTLTDTVLVRNNRVTTP